MALQNSINRQEANKNDHDNDNDHHEFDEEINETEEDLIENYRFLTQNCGVLRQSPTAGILNTFQKQQTNQSLLLRQYSSRRKNPDNNDRERSVSLSKQRCSPSNDSNDNNNLNSSTTISRVPPTIYYDDTEDKVYTHYRPFSLIKLFARMKTRLKHEKRYHPNQTHELLRESDPQEWYDLTKNVQTVLKKALLPDGGYDALIQRSKTHHNRQDSYRKSREYHPVLSKDNDDEDKVDIDIDVNEELNPEENDEIIREKFVNCSRGLNYRRCGICKAVDRQQYQGQLVYFYGVANNILVDENLKASGLG